MPEVWKFSSVRLTFTILQTDCTYKIVDKSPTFPKVTPDEIAGWLQSGIFRDDMEWLKDVRAWLKERAAHS